MLAQLVSVALTASVKATDTKSVSSFNHFHIFFFTKKGVHPCNVYLGYSLCQKQLFGNLKRPKMPYWELLVASIIQIWVIIA